MIALKISYIYYDDQFFYTEMGNTFIFNIYNSYLLCGFLYQEYLYQIQMVSPLWGLNGTLRQFTEPGTKPDEQLIKPQVLAVIFQSIL